MSTTEVVGAVVGIVAMSLLAAAIAAGETALTRMSRTRAESLAAEGRPGAPALAEVLADRQSTLSPFLLLRLLCHLGIATLITVIVRDQTTSPWLFVVLAVETAVLYVLAEAVPRTWALQHPDLAARRAAPLVRAIVRFAPLRWVTSMLNGIANVILPGPARPPVVSEDELIAIAGEAAAGAAIDEEERDLIELVLALGDTIVREVMVPRTDMVTVAADATIAEAIDLAIAEGLSRMPVCGEGIDDIVGVSLVRDLTGAERAGRGERSVRTEMRRARFVPETKHVGELLREMQAAGHHLAIAIDEYGGTAGLVTLEDIVEELVGEIVDEYDREEPMVEPLANGEALVHGRMPVDQLNQLIDVELPDGDWDTVGGLIFNTVGHVPELGETVSTAGLELRVERMEGRRITRVRLRPAGEPTPDPAETL